MSSKLVTQECARGYTAFTAGITKECCQELRSSYIVIRERETRKGSSKSMWGYAEGGDGNAARDYAGYTRGYTRKRQILPSHSRWGACREREGVKKASGKQYVHSALFHE
jgi:hypothetical protein